MSPPTLMHRAATMRTPTHPRSPNPMLLQALRHNSGLAAFSHFMRQQKAMRPAVEPQLTPARQLVPSQPVLRLIRTKYRSLRLH